MINDEDVHLISNAFFNFRDDRYSKYFLNKKINLKNPYSIQSKNISFLKNINNFFKNVIDISIIEFKAIIKESLPETIPLYYEESNLKIL